MKKTMLDNRVHYDCLIFVLVERVSILLSCNLIVMEGMSSVSSRDELCLAIFPPPRIASRAFTVKEIVHTFLCAHRAPY